jgi:predicted O-methyltransferase YrrM
MCGPDGRRAFGLLSFSLSTPGRCDRAGYRAVMHTDERPLPWKSDTLLDFGDAQVELCIPPELYERQSTPGHFIIGKSRAMIESMMAAVAAIPVENIVDVGVYKGGSVVFLNEAFRPRRLVGIESYSADLPPLREYCSAPDRKSRIGVYLGVNQADRAALAQICRQAFDDAPIDLVVDDASHFYTETRETFRALFPRLRPGSIYIVEDWAWAHWPEQYWQKELGGDYFRDKPPLSNLLVELMLLCAGSPSFVRRVSFTEVAIYIERGSGAIPQDFEPSEYYFNRGDPVPIFGARSVQPAQLSFSGPTIVWRQA